MIVTGLTLGLRYDSAVLRDNEYFLFYDAYISAKKQKGVFYGGGEKRHYQKCFPVKAVDTTAAGDTFTGYFVFGLLNGYEIEKSLELAAKAASIAVSRSGAVPSIPVMEEVVDKRKLEQ